MQCPNCGFDNPSDFNFCGKCGARLTAAPAASAPPSASLQRLRDEMPEALAAKVRAAERLVTSESRVISVLFADVVGSVRLASRLEPEVWLDIVREAHQRMSRAIYKYEGFVAQLLGDGLLAYFGAPVAHEDDPERAVRAALALQVEMQKHAAELAASSDVDLAVRVAINTGPVVMRSVRQESHVEYLAVGDMVNVAARAQSEAIPGTVVVTEETQRLVRGVFETRSLGVFTFKGKDEPITLHQVVRLKAEARRRGLEGIDLPLVGREEQMITLKWWVDQQRAGEGRAIVVVGEPGMGKSRLIAEVRRSLIGPEVRWFEGRCLSFTSNIVYAPWLEIARQFFGIDESDSDETIEAAIKTVLQEYVPEQVDKFLPPLVAFATQRTEALKRRSRLTPTATTFFAGDPLFRALRGLFAAAAARQPFVIVVDDLHWADPSSIELTIQMVAIVRSTPTLFIGILRTGPEGKHHALHSYLAQARAYSEHFTEITLPELPPEEARQLLDTMLGDRYVPEQLKAQILERAEGNPLTIEDSVKKLRDTGWFTAGDRPTTSQSAAGALASESIKGIVAARIDRLDDEAKTVLQTAAVIGRHFSADLLQQVSETDNLEQHLKKFELLELIRKPQDGPDPAQYAFRNIAVHEVAYQSLLPSQRRRLHKRIAEFIEQRQSAEPDEHPSISGQVLPALAYHYSRAQDWERAVDYVRRAGEQVERQPVGPDALRFFADALANYDQALNETGCTPDPIQNARWERRIADIYYGLRDHAKARTHAERALAHLGHPMERIQQNVWLTSARQFPRLLGALALMPFRRRHSFADHPAAREEFWGLLRLGYLYYNIGAWPAMATNVWRVAILATRHPAPSAELARLELELASLLLLDGWSRPPTRWLLLRSARHMQEVSDEVSVHVGHLTWGMYECMRGNLDEALTRLDAGLEFFASHGQSFEWTATVINVMWFYYTLGDLARCESYAREILETGEQAQSPALESWGRFLLALVSERRGNISAAIELLGQAQTDFDAAGEHTGRFAVRGLLAHCWLRRGDYGRAIREAQQTLVDRSRQRVDMWSLSFPQSALANALVAARQAGDLPGRGGLRRVARATQEWMRLTKRFRLGEPDALVTRAAYEEVAERPAAAKKTLARALARAEAMGQTYVAARARIGLARLTDDADAAVKHLQRALNTFEELGAVPDAESTREMLAATTLAH